ncbi:MAG: hypothetical protein FJY19_07000 [Bacteroidetes bacterium]|nr:hypothetical protein [Bacteroidota bacterium]
MKQITLFALLISCSALAIAQPPRGGGGFQRRTPAERAALVHQKLDSAFKLDAAKLTLIDTALTVLYRKQEVRMQEVREMMMNGGESIDREAIREEMQKWNSAQEEILKAVLTSEQFTIWKEQLLPSLRPARPAGAGGGAGNGRGSGN